MKILSWTRKSGTDEAGIYAVEGKLGAAEFKAEISLFRSKGKWVCNVLSCDLAAVNAWEFSGICAREICSNSNPSLDSARLG